MTLYAERYDSPCGPLRLVVDDAGTLHGIELLRSDVATNGDLEPAGRRAAAVARQLAEYFAGRRRRFELPLEAAGTAFQQAVWEELRRIPFGTTRSYGEIAATLGRPGAARAVGGAAGANPIPIVIPCHRVIGSDRSLTGFGGGLDWKRRLLALEGHGEAAGNGRQARLPWAESGR